MNKTEINYTKASKWEVISGYAGLLLLEVIIFWCAFDSFPYEIFGPTSHQKYERTRRQIDSLSLAANCYYLDTKQYPKEIDDILTNPGIVGWRGPYLQNVTNISTDSRGKPYLHYVDDQHGFIIISAGPDGDYGTGDDLNNIRKKE